jgi:hypothetical protein
MFARFLRIPLWVAVLPFAAIAALWGSSYFYANGILCMSQGTVQTEIFSIKGDLEISVVTGLSPKHPQQFTWQSTPISQLGFLGRHRNILDAMLSFSVRDRSFPLTSNPAGPKYRIRLAVVPMWTLFILFATVPTWIILRGRKKNRWRLRKDVRWTNPPLDSRIARFALFSAVGAVVGILVTKIEMNYRYDGSGTTLEIILPWVILLPTLCLLVFVTRRRIPFHKALLWMSLELAGSVCFYSFATERTGYYYGILSEQDTPQAVLLLGVASFACAAILLFFFQLKPEPVKPGPYCPQCGYCLIGSPRQICSECGRPFTHEELGVTPEALIPSAAPRLTTG